jgi:aldose sugar dehydrogenase
MRRELSIGTAALSLLATAMLLGPTSAGAQQAKVGVAPTPLTQSSYVFDTGEEHDVRVVVLLKGLDHPFALALLPDGDALVSIRGGDLRLVHHVTGANDGPAVLDPRPISGVPQLRTAFRGGGLQDVAIDPDFARNHFVYFTFNAPGKPIPASHGRPASHQSLLTLMRGTLSGHALVHVKQLFRAGPSAFAGGSRIALDGHGMLYLATGAPFGNGAQLLDSDYGKVLRLRTDGSVPPGNPFVDKAGARPEVFSYGHRDQLGLTVDPLNGKVLDTEQGPEGGDKVNVILPGRDYGWPIVTYGRNYNGTSISSTPIAPGFEPPLLVWIPDIAPGNLLVYTGSRFPAWKGNLFVTSAERGGFPHTGGVVRVVFNAHMQELRRELLFPQLHQRMRDIRQGADGLLYVVTDEDDGALLRIEPAPGMVPH